MNETGLRGKHNTLYTSDRFCHHQSNRSGHSARKATSGPLRLPRAGPAGAAAPGRAEEFRVRGAASRVVRRPRRRRTPLQMVPDLREEEGPAGR